MIFHRDQVDARFEPGENGRFVAFDVDLDIFWPAVFGDELLQRANRYLDLRNNIGPDPIFDQAGMYTHLADVESPGAAHGADRGRRNANGIVATETSL